MSGSSNVTPAIPRFVGVKVRKGALAAIRERTGITVVGIEAIVYVSVEAARPVKPRARPNENAAGEPVGPVIPVGRAIVRSVIEVSVGAHGRHVDTSGDLASIRTRDDAPAGKSRGTGQGGDREILLHENVLSLAIDLAAYPSTA
jgi:hypothetical protein